MDIINILKSKGVKVLTPEESAEAVDLNDPCVFCSVCHYMNEDGDKLNCPKFNKNYERKRTN